MNTVMLRLLAQSNTSLGRMYEARSVPCGESNDGIHSASNIETSWSGSLRLRLTDSVHGTSGFISCQDAALEATDTGIDYPALSPIRMMPDDLVAQVVAKIWHILVRVRDSKAIDLNRCSYRNRYTTVVLTLFC